ncbi:MAG: redoxin domain-containing protein [Gammaproteobacteria bacterium]|jgi:peroxiredoxin
MCSAIHHCQKALFIAVVVMLWFTAVSTAYAEQAQPLHAVTGKPMAANFNLKDIHGERHVLKNYRGRVVIVNFWATWCPPCRFELPSMERAYAQLKTKGIEILAINVGESEDTIFTFTADYPVTFPLLMDRDSAIINQYPVMGLPTTFVIDGKGRLVYRAIGTRDWDNEALLDQIIRLQQP